jgi:hypothetical protein
MRMAAIRLQHRLCKAGQAECSLTGRPGARAGKMAGAGQPVQMGGLVLGVSINPGGEVSLGAAAAATTPIKIIVIKASSSRFEYFLFFFMAEFYENLSVV